MPIAGRIRTVLLYLPGVLGWWVLLIVLQTSCIFNFSAFVDGLWMRDLHDGLAQNVLGEIAYRAGHGYGDLGCGDRYIYSILYRPAGEEDAGQVRSLTSLIDVSTWKPSGGESIFAYYVDANHRYRVRWISDGADLYAEDR